MSPINIALQKGYQRYYNTLKKLGSIDTGAVKRLIVAQWISDVLEGKYDCLVSDEQYSLLSRLYMCVEGSCLVPYQNYCKEFTVNKIQNRKYFRMTETNTIDISGSEAGDKSRILEDTNNLRTL